MRISDLIKMGLRNLFRRKVRTLLTVLGVVIGTLFIVIMRSIGHGMEYNIETQLKEMGSLSTITVNTYGEIYDEDGNYVDSKQQKLDDALVEQIRGIKHVRAVTPLIQKDATLYSGKYQGWTYITAIDKEVFEAFDYPALTMGEYPSEEDDSGIVFGYMQPRDFYDPTSRMWTPITIDITKDKLVLKFQNYTPNERKKEFSLPLKKVAKMEETKGEYDYNTYMDMDYFKEIYLKYCNTLSLEDRKMAIKSLEEYSQIMLNADNIENVVEIQDKIQELGYSSFSMMQYLNPMIESSKSLQMLLLVLGTAAMFVSAISIANTMVMAIYERTKEIGIMKVLGCVIKDIRKLFLFESGMLGFFGGLLGVGCGYIASYLLNKYGQPLFGSLSVQITTATSTKFSIIPIYLPFLAVALSTGVGLIFGYFPARRATKISSIEAMKNEG
ncbi:MAG TPA: FtsX-like permease family protein [Mobilitalea sp.]|nr:FtsX-like permease family protein [Mobilitalea sp.]